MLLLFMVFARYGASDAGEPESSRPGCVFIVGRGVKSSSASSAILTMSMKLVEEDGMSSNEALGLARGGMAGDLVGLACRKGDVPGEGEYVRRNGTEGSDLVRAMGGAESVFGPECGLKGPRL